MAPKTKEILMGRENIQPCAWQAIGGSIWGHKTSEDDRALYDQDALDAAVSEERERCALLCEQRVDTALGYVLGPDCAAMIRKA